MQTRHRYKDRSSPKLLNAAENEPPPADIEVAQELSRGWGFLWQWVCTKGTWILVLVASRLVLSNCFSASLITPAYSWFLVYSQRPHHHLSTLDLTTTQRFLDKCFALSFLYKTKISSVSAKPHKKIYIAIDALYSKDRHNTDFLKWDKIRIPLQNDLISSSPLIQSQGNTDGYA